MQDWLLTIRKFTLKPQIDFVLSSCQRDTRPYLDVHIFGNKYRGLLDSGATRTIVGKAGWDKLRKHNLRLAVENVVSCTVADGSTCDVIGTVDLLMALENKTCLINVLVIPSIPHELILGVDFWMKMRLLPDINSGTWSFVNAIKSETTEYMQTLTDKQKRALNGLVEKYAKLSSGNLGCTTLVEHRIITHADPIKQRYYPVNPVMQAHLDRELDKMLRDGVVEPSSSPWSSPVLLVRKSDNTYRFVVDYRKLNSVTQKDAYPLPYVNAILDKLRNARYLSSLDLKSAYWQIPVAEDSKEKTAFTVPGRGLYQFNRMPFGLHNSPATWQRLMDRLFDPSFEPFVFVYLDDIIVITPTFDEHLQTLTRIFDRLTEAGLTINPEKCRFCRPELKYLGYVVDHQGLHVDPDKVRAILEIPTPQNVPDIRRFIGVASWYRRFIPSFSTTIAPLTELLKKNKVWMWTDECEHAFNHIKEKLISAPILNCPNYDLPFFVQTDASAFGLGAVLTQQSADGEYVISYASRTLTKSERNLTVTEKECLAVIFGIEKFRPYLEGIKFTVITDHYSLLWLNNLKDPIGRLARWAVRLQQFDFDIVHRKGKDHIVPDLLSRAVEQKLSLITIENDIKDPWYRELRFKVRENPNSFPKWKLDDNNNLYKLVPNKNQPEWKLVVPKDCRQKVLVECHDAPTAGHTGMYKTFHRTSQLYYWPKMRADITEYVRRCVICQSQKPTLKVPAGLMGRRPFVHQPWQLISVDFMEFPKSSRGHEYLLVVTDYFSKFVILHPMRTATATKLCEFIENEVFLKYGVPQYLICDNGRQFISNDFKNLMSNYSVKIMYNALYHPQNNPTERTNRIIKTMIRSYLGNNHRKWDENLAKIACAINTGQHEVTKRTPYFINFGREHVLDGKYFSTDREPINPNELRINRDNLDNLNTQLKTIFSEVRKELLRAYDKNSRVYNLRRRDDNFDVGDRVWRKNYVLSDGTKFFSSKLAPKYVGPFRIASKPSNLTYELSDLDGNAKGIWHVQDLKRFMN